ncbi:imidazole glycerol phosphate synthase subunit HisF [Pedobacter boryungensis]|uniref:imidazole glycerol-phosphate synthase n=1 Tax=Pedobacter boryungensis TaxID=869962 RepID=A0ABX2DI28_9SPHI|nr:imidazole glycerol phosphate synthase cyclase subunit [Pedobacter boryungensis]NQX32764.1 imidazole glycerol phosphate synthase subunit HisF [Pedobacter boryungensis]
MSKKRLIARIDVKNEFVIKGIHLEGLRKVGDPFELARRYYHDGIDEIIFMDAVASLYGRNNLFHIIEQACKEVFVPITIGGGIRSINDIEMALKSGADKISLNTQAIKTPNIITEASRIYGSQCIVGSIEAKRKGNSWEAYVDNGREETGIDAIEWACKLEQLGAGELMVTSIDQEGTKRGFEIPLIEKIAAKVSIPVIASGGAGNPSHVANLCKQTKVSAVAIAAILHYNSFTVGDIKKAMDADGIKVRI